MLGFLNGLPVLAEPFEVALCRLLDRGVGRHADAALALALLRKGAGAFLRLVEGHHGFTVGVDVVVGARDKILSVPPSPTDWANLSRRADWLEFH